MESYVEYDEYKTCFKKSQSNFQHYVKKIEAQAKKMVLFKKMCIYYKNSK